MENLKTFEIKNLTIALDISKLEDENRMKDQEVFL